MDIDLLSKMVRELILDRDEVSLPGVGVFVAEDMPSTFSDKGYTINPPYRRLSFRQRQTSDSSLVDLYAESNSLDKPTAQSIMEKFLSEMKDLLKTKKTIVFPGLGRLRATKENNFFFIPDEDLNICPESFGLEPVSLKTHVETEDDLEAAVATIQSIMDEPVAVAVPEPVPEPVVESDPVIEDIPEIVIEPADEPVAVEPAVAEPAADEPRRRRTGLWVAVAIVALAAVLFGVFMLLCRVAPDFIDKLLYTQEELDIIRQL